MNKSTNEQSGVEKYLLRVPEAAHMAGIGRSTAYALVAEGRWPVVRIGRAVRIPVGELQKWIDENTTKGENYE